MVQEAVVAGTQNSPAGTASHKPGSTRYSEIPSSLLRSTPPGRTQWLPSVSAAGLKLLSPVPGSPPVAPDAVPAVKLVVASSTATKQAPNAICDPRTAVALRRPRTPTADPAGPAVAVVGLPPTIRSRR